MKILFGFFVFFACIFVPQSYAWLLKSPHDSTVYFSNGESATIRANQAQKIETNEAFMIRSRGRVPVLVAPMPASDSEINVNAPEVDNWMPDQVSRKIAMDLNFIMAEFETIRAHLKDKNPDKALAVVRSIKNKYPQLSYVNFLEASALVMKSDFAQAKLRLEEGLKDFPDHRSGQELLRALRGNQSP